MESSLRARSLSATWAIARALMPALGISRVTDITRLDRLGLPVHASVRPRGRILRVHAGKGFSPETSRVGALMEAIELALAEADGGRAPDGNLPWRVMQGQWPVAWNPLQFAPQAGAAVDPERVWPVVEVESLDLASGHSRRVPVPDELVRCLAPESREPAVFPWSSNGLASGNTIEEASLHALLELLERDSLALDNFDPRSQRLTRLPDAVSALGRGWSEAGVELVVRHVPNEFGLACFQAVLYDETSVGVNLAEGSGLHLDRNIALARAVSEAAQSRLSTLHGGRDDITHFYAKYDRINPAARLAQEGQAMARLRDKRRQIPFDKVPHRPHANVDAAWRDLRELLVSRGFPVVLRHRLRWPASLRRPPGLAAVKLVVPNLEVLEHHNRRIGSRLLRKMVKLG